MAQGTYLSRACPICNEPTEASFITNSPQKAEELPYSSLAPYWNGFFKEKLFFSYARCMVCDLLYAPIFFSSVQLEALYTQMPPNMDVVPLPALVRTQKGYFNELTHHTLPKGAYIEVGPDIGLFTANCAKEGFFEKYWLFEPNGSVSAQLSSAMQGQQFTIVDDMFGFDVVPNKTVGLVVMIQVLDHLLDPVKTLAELREKLLPGARLLFVTHNEQSILRKIVGWRWPAFCLQHPQIYNQRSITALLNKAGYHVESIKKTRNYFQCSFLLKHLFWSFGLQIKSVPKIFDFSLGLKLGNIITVATPK
jgi:hypothetical protein